MSDTLPQTDPDDVAPPEVDGVDVEYVDPEPDETLGGDIVQLVSTGWIRLTMGDERVRFRPARVGELRKILEAHEQMLDAIADEADRIRTEALPLDKQYETVWNSDASDDVKARAFTENRKTARHVAATLNRFTEEQRLDWWRLAHSLLGVSSETLPSNDDLPAWMLEPSLIITAIQHWRSVPLDRGRRPKQTR